MACSNTVKDGKRARSFFIWIEMIAPVFALIALLIALVVGGDIAAKFHSVTLPKATAAPLFFVLTVSVFLLALWQYKVLTSPKIKEMFTPKVYGKKTMRKSILLVLLAFSIFWIQCSKDKNPTAPEPEDLDTFIKKKMEEAKIPGLAAAIVAEGKVAWTAGYGYANVEAQRPVTPDIAFSLGSASKLVLAVALMQVWEKGKLPVDGNINDMLPFTVDNPHVAGEIITPRHLATHTSGIIDNEPVREASYSFTGDSPIALGDFLKGYLVTGGQWYNANQNYAAVQPGQQWSYSSIAAGLAGYLIETTTGAALDDHSDANIFRPLGMTNTGWRLSDFPTTENIAVPYAFENGKYQPYSFYGYPTWPDGGLRSSVADLGRFLAAVMNGGDLDGVRILNKSTVDEMLRSQIPAAQLPTGLKGQGIFWVIVPIGNYGDFIGHTGGDPGVNTFLFFQPSTGVGVIGLMNGDGNDAAGEAIPQIGVRLYERGLEITK
jgi:CubicO group peptidase (beta-lactamase class C family)